MVESDAYRCRLRYIFKALIIDRYESVVLDIFVDKTHDESLAYHSIPEACVLLLASTKELKVVMSVALDHGSNLAHEHRYKVVNFELVANSLQSFECKLKVFLSLYLWLGVAAVVARTTARLRVLLAEVV